MFEQQNQPLPLEQLTSRVIGACIEVHRHLGPNLLESAYERCVCQEMRSRGLTFSRQVPIPLDYKGLELHCGYRADIIVEGLVLLEIKAVERVLPIHQAQVITYLKLTQRPVGLLVNFHVVQLRSGVLRLVNPRLGVDGQSGG